MPLLVLCATSVLSLEERQAVESIRLFVIPIPHNSHTFRASSPSPPTRGSAVGRLHRKTSELEKEAKISLDEKGDVRKVSAAIASTLSSSPRIAEYGLQLLLSGLEHFTLSEAGGGGAGGGGGGIDDGSSPRGGAEEIAQLRAENEQLRARIMQLEVRLL